MNQQGKDEVNQTAGIEFGNGLREGGIMLVDEIERTLGLYTAKYKAHNISIAALKMILKVMKTRITKD